MIEKYFRIIWKQNWLLRMLFEDVGFEYAISLLDVGVFTKEMFGGGPLPSKAVLIQITNDGQKIARLHNIFHIFMRIKLVSEDHF